MGRRKPIPGLSAEPRLSSEILARGVRSARLYTAPRRHPIRGVVMAPNALSMFEARTRALALVLQPGQFFSRRTAARLAGIPTARLHDETRVDVGAVLPVRAPERAQVRGHHLRPETLEAMPSAPCWLPTAADIWCLLAQVASRGELLAAGDYLLSGASRRAPALVRREELAAAVRRFSRCGGGRLRREILPLLRSGVESPMESRTRLLIVDAGLPEPAIQCPVPTADRVFHADLGYAAARIAIEYEGAHHFGVDGQHGLEQARRDITRIRAMEAAGWNVLRVTVHDVRNPERFLRDLRAALRRA